MYAPLCLAKTAAITGLAPPTTVHRLQHWPTFIAHSFHALLTSRLHCLVCSKKIPKKGRPRCAAKLDWGKERRIASEVLCAALANPPVLRLFDPALPGRVSADASSVALGGVLEQEHAGVWLPVAYYSRNSSPAESECTTRERERLAVMQCLVALSLGSPIRCALGSVLNRSNPRAF